MSREIKYQQGYMVEALGKAIVITDFVCMTIATAAKVEVPDFVYICPVALGLVGINMIFKGREMMMRNNFR